MPKIDLIEFTYGDFPQYPECPYAGFKGNCWRRAEIPVVWCLHAKAPNKVCVSNIRDGVCPYNLEGGKLDDFKLVKCGSCLCCSSRVHSHYPNTMVCRLKGSVDDNPWNERECKEFILRDYREEESNSSQELWNRWQD
jgi:hypothetical protein